MQNRGALWIFTVLLALACAYQLSFSIFTSGLERKAAEEAAYKADSVLAVPGNEALDREGLKLGFENSYLRANGEQQVYPVLGYTYRECKEKEINLGLDLKGGMAVTLEVSIPELIDNLSGNSTDPAFRQAMASARERQKSSDADFITLFGEEYAKVPERGPLSAIFYTPDRKDMFDREGDDASYLSALRNEAETALNNTERILRTRIDKFGVAQPSIQKQAFSGRIQIELPGVKDKDRVRKVLQSTANLEFWETYDNTEVYPALEAANTRLRDKLKVGDVAEAVTDSASVDTIGATGTETAMVEAATDSLATDSLATDDLATDSLSTDTLNAADFAKENPLFAVLTPSLVQAQNGFNLARGSIVGTARLADTAQVNSYLERPEVIGALPKDLKLAWGAKPDVRELTDGGSTPFLNLFALKVPRGGKPKLDGSSIVNAAQDFDMKGEVEVTMQMDAEGAQTWKVMTGDNVGKAVAIVLDDLVYSAPVVQSEIAGGRSSISMGTGNLNEQIQEADDLANILKAGALPAPARIIDETVVGPSLGSENIRLGMYSFAVALLIVMLYMVLYYSTAGWVADLALLVNLFVLIGSLASLQAALTLPGIAGIVLTMGMAVDANVLIYERIREELRQGKMLKSAVDLGYKGAMSAIIDSNVTTLLTAVILYIFGSGPIRGFATTLGLGILTSLFTALFLSRMIISWRLEKGKSFSVWSNWSKDILVKAAYDFMGKRKVFYAVSGVLIGAGIVSMVTVGFNWGVDFSGGRTYVVKFAEDVQVDEVRGSLEPSFRSDEGVQSTVQVKSYGGARQVKVTTNYLVDRSGEGVDAEVDAKLAEGLAKLNNPYEITESRKVDATISDDIKFSAITSVLVALLGIFLYIAVRFRNWQYGLGALLSLLHDALALLGLYSILWKVMPFSMEIDEAFIAAVLTVLGYSINDTVVVFDRLREYIADHKRESYYAVINKAINSTLGRTMNTSLTTLLVLFVIFLFGGVSIKGFIFALLIGILVGTYSSVFIASAVLLDLLKGKDPNRTA
ncbi:MAG: protein translocase subunit SecDF [Flavobacteriales bacterium]